MARQHISDSEVLYPIQTNIFIGPSVLRVPAEQLRWPLFLVINLFGPSGVRALPLADCTNEGGHYFR